MAEGVCPTCGAEIPEGATACPVCGTPLDPTFSSAGWNPRSLEGKMVGEYRIESLMAAGGMGIVYVAEHPVIGKKAVVKILKKDEDPTPEAYQRFLAEARAVNKIGHPNIVDVFSFGELDDGTPYMIMEYLEGETLHEYMKSEGTVPWAMARTILDQILDALAAAHAKKIVHRDLKPDNIFLQRRDDGVWVKLLDFGIAKFMGEGALVKTTTGMPMGTPHFMSPEQCAGAKEVDARSDLYSLGVIMYRMFTGAYPFHSSTSAVAIMNAHMFRDPPPPSMIAEIPADLEEIILWCLRKDPAERPQSASELRERLMPVLERLAASGDRPKIHGDPAITTVSPADFAKLRKSPPVRRVFWLVGATLLLFLTVLGYLVWKTAATKKIIVVHKTVEGMDGRDAVGEVPQSATPVAMSPEARADGERTGSEATALPSPPSGTARVAAGAGGMAAEKVAQKVSIPVEVLPAGVDFSLEVLGKGEFSDNRLTIPRGERVRVRISAPGYRTVTTTVSSDTPRVRVVLPRRRHATRRTHGIRYPTPSPRAPAQMKPKASPMVDDYL